MKTLAALLVVVLVATSGCAEVMMAASKFPQRTEDAFTDPVRRVHLATQVSRVASAVSVGLACTAILAPTLVGMLACPVIAVVYDYLSFEYVLEPLSRKRVNEGKPSLVGPYWETGPRTDGGEVFVNP